MAFYSIFSKERSQSQMPVATPNASQTEQLIFKQKAHTCDAKPITQLAALPAQLLARQQARSPASNPAGKHAPYAAGFRVK